MPMRQRSKPRYVLGKVPQLPKEKVLAEIEAVKQMIVGWKESYMRQADELGGGMFLCEELWSEVRELASPYIYRMVMCGYITIEEYDEFMGFCASQVEELGDYIKRIESSQEVGDAGKV